MTETPTAPTPQGFSETYCKNCQAGFVCTCTDGRTFIMCLIDQQMVFPNIASCTRRALPADRQENRARVAHGDAL
jgi:hypothetical protein